MKVPAQTDTERGRQFQQQSQQMLVSSKRREKKKVPGFTEKKTVLCYNFFLSCMVERKTFCLRTLIAVLLTFSFLSLQLTAAILNIFFLLQLSHKYLPPFAIIPQTSSSLYCHRTNIFSYLFTFFFFFFLPNNIKNLILVSMKF